MFIILRGVPEIVRRRWRAVKRGDKLTALVSCPTCGRLLSITGAIDANGEVRTLLKCVLSSCQFEDWVRLDGWES